MHAHPLLLAASLLTVHLHGIGADVPMPLGPAERATFCGEPGREDGATAAYARAVKAWLDARAREGVGERRALAELETAIGGCPGKSAAAARPLLESPQATAEQRRR